MKNKKRVSILLLIGFGIIGCCLLAIKKIGAGSEAAKNQDVKNLPVVSVETAKNHNIQKIFSIWAYLLPAKEVNLKLPPNVKVGKILAPIGTKVLSGQPILSFDSEPQRLRAELDKLDLELKNIDYKVTLALAKRNFLSNNDFKTKSIEFRAQQIRAQLSALDANSNLISPIAGVVAENDFKPGDYIDTSNNNQVKIIDNSSLRVLLSVPANTATKLSVGDKARLERENQSTVGIVKSLAPMVDPKSGTVSIEVEIPNAPQGWNVGQYTQVSLVTEETQDAVTVPANAIVSEGKRSFVYVLKDDKEPSRSLASEKEADNQATEGAADTNRSVQKMEVKLGLSEDGLVEITEGLEENAQIITKGLTLISDGSKVEIKQQ